MGLSQSKTVATEVSVSEVTPSTVINTTPTVVESRLATPVVKSVVESVVSEETKTEVKEQETVPPAPNSTPTETVADAVTTSGSEVFARHIMPIGTKIEVAPVEVTPTTDVVKKNKNKNKKKNKDNNSKND
jgi:hypothetical protein